MVYKPIASTDQEKTFKYSDSRYDEYDYQYTWIFKQLQTARMYKWDGTDKYITLVGLTKYYGEHPIMQAIVHNPEIYPSPELKNVTYDLSKGEINYKR